MEEMKEDSYFKSNMKIIQFASYYWKFLLGVAVVSGMLAVFFSGPKFITPKFTSEAVIYPANLGDYSGETRLDQMQQYLYSSLIRDSIINKFNLYEEYEIDPSYIYAKTYMNLEYSEHVKIEETRYESVKISVSSTDPEKAKKMADEILRQLNLTIRNNEKVKFKELIEMDKGQIGRKKEQIDSVKKGMQEISTKYNILDYEAQSEVVTEAYLDFLLEGKKGPNFEKVSLLYDNLKKYGAHYKDLSLSLDSLNAQLMSYQRDYDRSFKNYKKDITYSYVIVHPQVPDKKSYPIRAAIVISAMISTVGFTFILMLLLGYQKKKNA